MPKFNKAFNTGKRKRFDGISFQSRIEIQRYRELKLLEAAGKIFALDCHPKFKLSNDFELRDKHLNFLFSNNKNKLRKKIAGSTISFDFSYQEQGNNRIIVEDVKKKIRNEDEKIYIIKQDWLSKVKIWIAMYQNEYELRIVER